jgi:hypothetical protein
LILRVRDVGVPGWWKDKGDVKQFRTGDGTILRCWKRTGIHSVRAQGLFIPQTDFLAALSPG